VLLNGVNAVLLYTRSHTSLKDAGLAHLSFLSRLALKAFVKSEPLRGHQLRRIDSKKTMPLFRPVSVTSLRFGTATFELAKNEEMIEYFRNCGVLNGGYDRSALQLAASCGWTLNVDAFASESNFLLPASSLASRNPRPRRRTPSPWASEASHQSCLSISAVSLASTFSDIRKMSH
jgi:hypothetical protein